MGAEHARRANGDAMAPRCLRETCRATTRGGSGYGLARVNQCQPNALLEAACGSVDRGRGKLRAACSLRGAGGSVAGSLEVAGRGIKASFHAGLPFRARLFVLFCLTLA